MSEILLDRLALLLIGFPLFVAASWATARFYARYWPAAASTVLSMAEVGMLMGPLVIGVATIVCFLSQHFTTYNLGERMSPFDVFWPPALTVTSFGSLVFFLKREIKRNGPR
jgi:hypothetical protein